MPSKGVSNELCKERVNNIITEMIEIKDSIKDMKKDNKEDNKLITAKLNKIIGNDLTHVNIALKSLGIKVDSLDEKVDTISDNRKANYALMGNLITIILLILQYFMGA